MENQTGEDAKGGIKMTQRSIQEIEAWAINHANKHEQEYKSAPHYLSSNNGIHMSSNGEEKGRYELSIELCTFLGIEDKIKE